MSDIDESRILPPHGAAPNLYTDNVRPYRAPTREEEQAVAELLEAFRKDDKQAIVAATAKIARLRSHR
jgi:hypothetical protein